MIPFGGLPFAKRTVCRRHQPTIRYLHADIAGCASRQRAVEMDLPKRAIRSASLDFLTQVHYYSASEPT
jgi:hypothetical protein